VFEAETRSDRKETQFDISTTWAIEQKKNNALSISEV
jgi:hypothetical protein